MTNPEQEFAKGQEVERNKVAIEEARKKLEEAEVLYQKSLGEYGQLLEESKKYGSEVVDEAVGEYYEHLKKQADGAWDGEQYDEAFALVEKMRDLQKNYPESNEVILTDEEEKNVADESQNFYNALPNNLQTGNFRFVANRFRALALLLKKNGEPIDEKTIGKISATVKDDLRRTSSAEIAQAPFAGWHKGNGSH
jgi:hypothetical protein